MFTLKHPGSHRKQEDLCAQLNSALRRFGELDSTNPLHRLFARQFLMLERLELLAYGILPGEQLAHAKKPNHMQRTLGVTTDMGALRSYLAALPGYSAAAIYNQPDSAWIEHTSIACGIAVENLPDPDDRRPQRALELVTTPWPRNMVPKWTREFERYISLGRYNPGAADQMLSLGCDDFWDDGAMGCGALEGAIRLGCVHAAAHLVRAGHRLDEAPQTKLLEQSAVDLMDLAGRYVGDPTKLALLRKASMDAAIARAGVAPAGPATSRPHSTRTQRASL
ncbi:hypothetical protein ABIC83_002494 [Roseateles asaccharophilus]|uniref:hypothetical protein n=1 Tax=Roseateles asaccharophilus TaxID=582607 RepID=UPI0038394DCC